MPTQEAPHCAGVSERSRGKEIAEQSSTRITGNPWTTSELAILRKHASQGARAIAEQLGRSETSVRSQAQRSRISLRPKGLRGGRRLSIPADLSDASVAILDGLRARLAKARAAVEARHTVSLESEEAAIAQRIDEILGGGKLVDLCRVCGRERAGGFKAKNARRYGIIASDVCKACYLRALLEAYRAEALYVERIADAAIAVATARKARERAK